MDDNSSSTFGPLLSAILDHLTVGFVVVMLGRSILSMISSRTSPPPATTTGRSTTSAILLESLILSRALWLFYDQPLPATSNDSPFALHLYPLFGPHLYPVLFPLSIVWIILRRVLPLFSQMSHASAPNPTFEWPLLSAILDLVTQFLVLEIAFERVSWHSLVPTLRMVGTLGIALIISVRLLLKAWRKGTAAPSLLVGPTPLGDGGQPYLEDPNSTTPTTGGVGSCVPGLPVIVLGREDKFSEILRHLRDDQVGMVFICGPPGVGKTTLLKLIHHKFRRTDTRDFDVVAWVTMSKWSTAMEVQQQVGERLGLSLFAEGPGFVRETQARTLQRLLSRRRFLLLLDEFPKGAPEAAEHFLKEVGVPAPEGRPAGSNKSKIIIACTTKPCAGILHKQMGCSVRVVLVTGSDVPASQRLPQMLKYRWRKLVDDTERSLLLHCSLFPENHEIRVSELREYYSYINDENNSAAALDRKRASISRTYLSTESSSLHILDRLQGVGLIEKVDEAVREEECVKIHPAVREVALDAADGMNLVHAGQGLKVWPPSSMGMWASKKASPMSLSLMYNHIEELPTAGTDIELHKFFLPQLVTLMLNNNPLARVPDDFFLCMPILRVLDLSWTQIKDLPDTIGSLRGLRYLNLSHTPIRSLPQELRGLRELRQLCLNHTDRLRTIPRAAISSLSTLRRLDLLSTAHRWSEEADDDDGRTEANLDDLERLDTLKEVKLTIKSLPSLKRLNTLQRLQRATRSLLLDQIRGLRTETFVHINLGLGSVFGIEEHTLLEFRINEAPELGSLAVHEDVRNVLRVLSLDHLPRASISFRGFSCLRRLHAVGCHGLVYLKGASHLFWLEYLELRICHRLQVLTPGRVVSVVSDNNKAVDDSNYFPMLKKMVLWGLPSLRSISVRSPLRLPSLKYIEVYHCPELKKLPLVRWSANLIEEIHGSHEWWDGLEWDDQATKSALDPCFSDPRRHMEELEEETDEEYLVESTDEECINLESNPRLRSAASQLDARLIYDSSKIPG